MSGQDRSTNTSEAEQTKTLETDALQRFGLRLRSRPALSVCLLLLALCLFDILQRGSISVTSSTINLSLYGGMVALFVAALAIPMSRIRPSFAKARPVALLTGGVLFVPVFILTLHSMTLEPLKFMYLRHRVEAAKTADEELRALELAVLLGHVFESHYVEKQHLPERYRHVDAEYLFKVEWLETNPFFGRPYRAYRKIIDEANLVEHGWKSAATDSGKKKDKNLPRRSRMKTSVCNGRQHWPNKHGVFEEV